MSKKNRVWRVEVETFGMAGTRVYFSRSHTCDGEYKPGVTNLAKLSVLFDDKQDDWLFEFNFGNHSSSVVAYVDEKVEL